jgi:hypothetical protein
MSFPISSGAWGQGARLPAHNCGLRSLLRSGDLYRAGLHVIGNDSAAERGDGRPAASGLDNRTPKTSEGHQVGEKVKAEVGIPRFARRRDHQGLRRGKEDRRDKVGEVSLSPTSTPTASRAALSPKSHLAVHFDSSEVAENRRPTLETDPDSSLASENSVGPRTRIESHLQSPRGPRGGVGAGRPIARQRRSAVGRT